MGSNFRKIWPSAAVMVRSCMVWQAAVVLFGTPVCSSFPSCYPCQCVSEAPQLLDHTLSTLGVTLLGFTAGTAAGFVLAALLHMIPGAKSGLYPLLVLTQNVPVIALGRC